VSRHPAKDRLSASDVYAVTEYADPRQPETLTSILLGLPLHLQQTQLGLLVPESSLAEVIPEEATVQRLADQSIGQTVCLRIRVVRIVTKQDGSVPEEYTYWIDPVERLVRRIEFPTDRIFANVPPESRPQNAHLILDLDAAEFDRGLAATLFAMPISANTRFVRFFVLPPLPLPSELFGTAIDELEFTTLDGQTEKSSHWKGKHAVLVWFDGHEASKKIVSAMEQVYQQFKNQRDQVVFRAICVDPASSVTDREVRSRLNDWRISMPACRDTLAMGRDRFQIDAAPAVVVFGVDRKIQLFSVGADPQLGEDVSVVLQSLFQGTDVGQGVVDRFNEEQLAFQRQLAIASVGRPADVDLSDATIAEASNPKQLTLTEHWTSHTTEAPGNLLSFQDDKTKQLTILVVDKLREIVRLDVQGKEVARYKPDLSEDDAITYLQTFVTRGGDRNFVAWSTLGRRAYLFDSEFNLVVAYPTAAQEHPGIQDVLLADLDSDQDVEMYIAFRDPVGLHRVSKSGKRIWGNRTITGYSSITIDPAGFGRLLVCGDSGQITPIFFSDGQTEKPIVVAGRAIHSVTKTITTSTRPTQVLGMSFTLEGRLIAIGLNRNLQEQWSYGLPNGVFQSQVRTPVSVKLFDGSAWQWLLAGPDGSVHVIDDDGNFFDTFNSGHNVTGISGFQDSETGILLLSTNDSVRAIRVEKNLQ
jgi:hypothetical protein